MGAMRPRLLITMLVASILALHPSLHADSLAPKAKLWLSTGSSNSLEPAPELFTFGAGVISTQSEFTNIHTHFRKARFTRLKNYTYSGQMMMTDEDGGMGVTFHSQYPESDTYYRLRTFSDEGTFLIAPHPDGEQLITGGQSETGIRGLENTWYRFKVLVRTSRKSTRIRAKVWRLDDAEPNKWLVDCFDSSPIRIKQGGLGLWSAGQGSKTWRNLKVVDLQN